MAGNLSHYDLKPTDASAGAVAFHNVAVEEHHHQRPRALTAWDAPVLSAGKGGGRGGGRGGDVGGGVAKGKGIGRETRKQSVYNGFDEEGMDESPV
jgi:hypothetical protein